MMKIYQPINQSYPKLHLIHLTMSLSLSLTQQPLPPLLCPLGGPFRKPRSNPNPKPPLIHLTMSLSLTQQPLLPLLCPPRLEGPFRKPRSNLNQSQKIKFPSAPMPHHSSFQKKPSWLPPLRCG